MAAYRYRLLVFIYITWCLFVHLKILSSEAQELYTDSSIFDEAFKKGLSLVDSILQIEKMVCSSTCRSGYPNRHSNSKPLKKCAMCYCDLLCSVYQDCCPDVLLIHGVTYNVSVSRCIGVKPVDNNRSESDVYTNVVVRCRGQSLRNEGQRSTDRISGDKSSGSSREISDICEHPDVTDPQQSLPVWSLDSHMTYRNIHCAQCHNDSSNTMRWETSISCSGTSSKLLNGALSKLDIFKRLMTQEGSSEIGCQLTFVPRVESHSRACRFSAPDLISACNVSGQWLHYDEHVARACAMYTSVFLFKYRNMFCFICNSEFTIDSMNELYQYVKDSPQVNVARLSYAAMLNFDEEISTSTVTYEETADVGHPKGRCPSQEIYDDVTCECRKLLCTEGKTLTTNGECQSMIRSNILGYHACVLVNVEMSRPMSVGSMEQFIFSTQFMSLPLVTKHSLHISQWCPLDTKIIIGWEIFVTGDGTLEDLEQGIAYLLQVLVETVEESFQDKALSSKFNFIDQCKSYTLQPLPCPKNESIFYASITPGVLRSDDSDDHRIYYIEFSDINKCSIIEVPRSFYRNITDHYEFIPGRIKVESSKLHFYNASLIRICVNDYLNLTQENEDEITCDIQNGVRNGTEDTWTISGLVSVISTCVSLTCLLMTLTTYILFKPLRAGSGQNMMTLIVCLIIAQTVYEFAIEQYESPRACAVFGLVIHFSWLAALFAMNACTVERFYKLCFPLSSRVFFMSSKPTLLVTLYTFLGPSVIVGANIVANITLGNNIGYGSSRLCFINAPIARIATFAIPVGVIVSINVLLMGVTVFKLRGRESARGFSNAHSRLGLMAVARLSVVTGLMWLLAFLYDLVRSEYFNYVITALIGLHGVLFFYTLVLNRRIIAYYTELWTHWRAVEQRSRSESCSKDTMERTCLSKVPQGTTSDGSVATSCTGCDSRQ